MTNGPPDYAVQMLHTQLFNVNTTCHNIPLGGSGSSVTPAVPRLSEAHLANRTAGSFQYRLLLEALMAAELSSYFCLLAARFASRSSLYRRLLAARFSSRSSSYRRLLADRLDSISALYSHTEAFFFSGSTL